LVQYWLYEAGIPLMRRNVSDPLLAEVDARLGDGTARG
jgi:hypothetical protein